MIVLVYLIGAILAGALIYALLTWPRIVPAGSVIAGAILVNYFHPGWSWAIPAAVVFAVVYLVAPRPEPDYYGDALREIERALDRRDIPARERIRLAQKAWNKIRAEKLPPDLDEKWTQTAGAWVYPDTRREP